MFDGDRMKKHYSIKIEYSPAYELVVSLYAYVHHREMKQTKLGKEWREATTRMLPADFARELEDERWELLHRIVLLIALCPDKSSVDHFLDWLEQVPPGEIYERLAPWVSSIPLNLGEIRDRSLYLLAEWNRHYFSRFDPDWLHRLEKDAARLSRQAENLSAPDLIEEATNGLRIELTESLKQVILVPQYHCRPGTILDFHRSMATCLYPLGEPQEDAISRLLPVTQCLADEKRLQILRYLAVKPRTLSDIQKHVQLAKSTVHHHVMALRRAGLIRSHFRDNAAAATHYSLRDSFVENLYEELKKFLREGE
jgi:DNA-binding transcriptional ArsR family regulator